MPRSAPLGVSICPLASPPGFSHFPVQMVMAANDELSLMAQMAAWKPWEGLPPPPPSRTTVAGTPRSPRSRLRTSASELTTPRAGSSADAVISTTEVDEHPGAYPQTMFAEGLTTESTRDPAASSPMKERDPGAEPAPIGKGQY